MENSIHSNGGLGIDLSDDGVTANDAEDLDSVPNHLQNFPVLSAVSLGNAAAADFNIHLTADRRYIIDFYASDSCDGSGNGEWKKWFGYAGVLTDETGYYRFMVSTLTGSIYSYEYPPGVQITATATDIESDTTSEFSPCLQRTVFSELVFSESIVAVTEDSAAGATYTVSLSSPPSGDVQVSMEVNDATVATISPESLDFTITDWSTPQTVTVTAVSDTDPFNESTGILHTVTVGGLKFSTALLPVEVTDDDALALTHTGFPDDVSEGHVCDGVIELVEGETDSYTVELTAEPADDVTLTIRSGDPVRVTLSKDTTDPKTYASTVSLNFEKDKWDEAQTVTVRGRPDAGASRHLVTITHETFIGGVAYILGRCAPKSSTQPCPD